MPHYRNTVRAEIPKKAMRKRQRKALGKKMLKYGAMIGAGSLVYVIAMGGLPSQVAAVKQAASNAIEFLASPVTDGKKNVKTYNDKANANKELYDNN